MFPGTVILRISLRIPYRQIFWFMANRFTNNNYINNDSDWRFYALTWEQCQSLILAIVVVGIVVIPQWLFSLVTVPKDYQEQQINRRHHQLLRQSVIKNHTQRTPNTTNDPNSNINSKSISDTDFTKEN